MTYKKDSLKNTAVKYIGASTVMTGSGVIIHTSGTLDLGLDKKYSAMKVLYVYTKTGTGTLSITITTQTDTVNTFNSATYDAAYSITLSGTTSTTDAEHGAISTAVNGLAQAYVDLSGAQRFVRILINGTFATTDTSTGIILAVLEGAREEPLVDAGVHLTTA